MYFIEDRVEKLMDITKFNKKLGKKISRANTLEKSNDFEGAIRVWLEISEMTLSFSKNPKLDPTYRNMLMKRTKGIFEHVKSLKMGMAKEEIPVEEIEPIEELTQEESTSEVVKSEDLTSLKVESEELQSSEPVDTSQTKVIEESEFKNLPEGFKEIETLEEFKIITPHDVDYVKKTLSKVGNMDTFKVQKEEKPESTSAQMQQKFDFEQPKDGENIICFACGASLPPNTKFCTRCGTSLK